MSALDLLEPFRAKIYTSKARYLQNGSSDAGIVDDILRTRPSLESLPNLGLFRWSSCHFDGMSSPLELPQRLFKSLLPLLQGLTMVNRWGLLLTDMPVLKVMLTKCIPQVDDLRHQPTRPLAVSSPAARFPVLASRSFPCPRPTSASFPIRITRLIQSR